MSNAINASVSEEILKTARLTVAMRLNPDVRHGFINGKYDHFAAVQAACDAIIVERNRCAELADYYAQAGIVEDPSGAAYYACGALAGEIRTPVIREAKPSVTIDDDELPF